jgi:glycosyltransferase involved in cell wall biosynthesis
VLDDDELRERFARASRRKALEEFDVRRVVREYVELYEKGADV